MKIGIDARLYGLEHAGIGRYIKNLLHHLLLLDQDNSYVIVTSKQNLELPGSNYQLITTNIRHYTVREQFVMYRLLQEYHLDLLHVPHFNIPLLYRGKLVTTIHDILWHQQKGTGVTTQKPGIYWVKYIGYRLIVNQAITRSNALIVPSQWVKNDLIKHFGQKEKLNVISEGVDHHLLEVSPTDPILNSLPRGPYCLYVGSCYPHKNLKTLIEAVNLMQSQPLNLVIVTSRSAFLADLKKYIKSHRYKRVHIHVSASDRELKTLIKHAVCVVQPSTSEGFGLTGLEAMALKTPVVSSNAAALPETYGPAALYFSPLDTHLLTQHLHTLQSHPTESKRLVALGLKQAAKFSWASNAKKTLEIYHQVYSK